MLRSSSGFAPPAGSNPASSDWETHARDLQLQVSSYPRGPVADALDLALRALGVSRFSETVQHAQAAVALTPDCVLGLRLLGLGHEGLNCLPQALEAYQAAHALDPDSLAILSDLGRLAMTLGLHSVAIDFFARVLAHAPHSNHALKQLAIALRDSHRYGNAIEILSEAIARDRDNAFLWNALASVLLQQGDTETALSVIRQALTLAPGWSEALYNQAIAKLELGDLAGSAADCDAAADAAVPDRRAAIIFVRAQARLAGGDLEGGWRDYAARLEPEFPTAPIFSLPGHPWDGRTSLKGADVLVVAEQGLGDEIMFSGMMPEVLRAVGSLGRVTVLAAPRLMALFGRSFPGVRVQPAVTQTVGGRLHLSAPPETGPVDVWIPMGSLPAHWLAHPSQGRSAAPWLKPDPAAAAMWRERMSVLDRRPKVGLSWKSMKTSGNRLKQYPSFQDWRPVLATHAVRFVTIQYGDCELEHQTASHWGVDIWRPPNLDLTQDIDGSASLCAGLDLVIGVGNASTNLAAATGVPTWFIFPPSAWPKLGTDRHPWFPDTSGFTAARFGQWEPVMSDVAAALQLWARQDGAGL